MLFEVERLTQKMFIRKRFFIKYFAVYFLRSRFWGVYAKEDVDSIVSVR